MKNLNLFPFERNNYYFGKLLTEQDFNSEQTYLNNKRRFINRFFHGVGIASGFQCVRLDDKTLTVESGAALDFAGRELVLTTPLVCRLSTIDGFDVIMEQNKKSYMYLCLEYAESETTPGYAVAEGSRSKDEVFEKYTEGVHFYLTDQEPGDFLDTTDGTLYAYTVIYEDRNFRVIQKLPRYLKSREEAETELCLESTGDTTTVSIKFIEKLENALSEGNEEIEVSFDNVILERGVRVTKSFPIVSKDLSEGNVRIAPVRDSFNLNNDAVTDDSVLCRELTIPFGELNMFEWLIQDDLKNSMDEITRKNYSQGIYLAKVYYTGSGKVYQIDRIDNLPFRQHLVRNQLSSALLFELKNELDRIREKGISVQSEKQSREEKTDAPVHERSSGIAEIRLALGGRKGQRFFSPEIFHGLGLGTMKIDVGIMYDNEVLTGSSEIFQDQDPKAEIAVKQDTGRGSFVIGIRLIEPTSKTSVRLVWSAERTEDEKKQEVESDKLFIKPQHLAIKVRESAQLEAVCDKKNGMTFIWNVKSPGGGSITDEGFYTAPSESGVYEVTAEAQENPDMKASVFIIVRDV